MFEEIVQSGLKLFPGAAVAVTRPEGDMVQLAAIADVDEARMNDWRTRRFPLPLTREYMHSLAILDRKVVDVPDAAASVDPSIQEGLKNFLASGYRAITVMPMLRADVVIGAISVVRREPGSEKQLALLRTFADQAVIAIENVRLFNETKNRSSSRPRSARSCASSRARPETCSRYCRPWPSALRASARRSSPTSSWWTIRR